MGRFENEGLGNQRYFSTDETGIKLEKSEYKSEYNLGMYDYHDVPLNQKVRKARIELKAKK